MFFRMGAQGEVTLSKNWLENARCNARRSREVFSRQTAIAYNAILGTDLTLAVDRWLRDAFDGAASVYDKAADAASYDAIKNALNEATQRGVDFAQQPADWHRFFGGHDAVAMWNSAKNALPDDTFLQEAQDYLTALWKDVVTPNGLPVVTIAPGTMEALTNAASDHLGIGKEWVADALSFTATEGIGAAIGGVALILGWTKADNEKFATMAGSLGVSALAAANPLLAVVAVVALARAYQHATHRDGLKAVVKGLGKGSAGTLAFVGATALLPGPLWVVIVSGIVLAILTRRGADNVPYEEVAEMVMMWLRRRGLWKRGNKLPALPVPLIDLRAERA